MSVANAFEVQMLALINAERAANGLQALKLNAKLNTSAETHSRWMLQADVFSHTGSGGSTPGARMQAAGYVFSGSWTNGENIAWQSERGAAGITDDVINLHTSLMNSPGHRANILNANFTEIGIGIETGDFTTGGRDWPAVIVTQNFARSAADNGGPGTSNPTPTPAPAFKVTEGNDRVDGTANGDVINGLGGNDRLNGLVGNDTLNGGEGDDNLLGDQGDDSLSGGGGNDQLYGGVGVDRLAGEAGTDRLYGGDGNDWLSGGDGNDRLEGGNQDDTLSGGAFNDNLRGDAGNDRLLGEAGNDALSGGTGDDWLDSGTGADTLTGGTNADSFIFRNGDGQDRITDFADNVDTLVFAGGHWDGAMTVQSFVSTYARVAGSSVIFDLGDGDVVRVDGISSLARLYDDILFLS